MKYAFPPLIVLLLAVHAHSAEMDRALGPALGSTNIITLDICQPTATNPRHDHQLVFPLQDGRLLLVWSEYYQSEAAGSSSGASRDDRPCRIAAKTSSDRGRSWSAPFVLQENTGKLNVKHPNLLRLPSGEVLLFCYYSDDDGHTWHVSTEVSYYFQARGFGGARGIRLKIIPVGWFYSMQDTGPCSGLAAPTVAGHPANTTQPQTIADLHVRPARVNIGKPVRISFHSSDRRVVQLRLTDPYYVTPAETLPGFTYDAEKRKSHRLFPARTLPAGAASVDQRISLDTQGWPVGARHWLLQALDAAGRSLEERPVAITVARPWDHLQVSVEASTFLERGTHFGKFAKGHDGTLFCGDRFSRDGGHTWQAGTGGFGAGAGLLCDGSVLGMDYRCLPITNRSGWHEVDRYLCRQGLSFSKSRAEMYVPEAKGAQGHAPHVGPLFMRSIIERADGVLVALMAGWFKSDTALCPYGRGRPYSRSYVCESEDGGRTWRYLSTIGYEHIGSEGYNEGSMRRLPDGSWLAVLRTGNPSDIKCQDNPIMWSASRDEGRTWSKPRRTGLEGCYPGLAVLENGLVVMSYGRPGAWIAFSADAGRTWTDVTCIDPTVYSGYTDVVQLRPGVLLVGFGTLGYYDEWTGDRADGLRLARVRYREQVLVSPKAKETR